MWFILIVVRGCIHNCLFWKESHWLAHHQFFGENWALPNRKHLFWTLKSPNRNKCASLRHHLFSWTLGEAYGINLRCYWEHLENVENSLRAPWEHIGNKAKNLSLPLPPRKKTVASWVHYAEPSHWLHETFIFRTVCHHFWPGLMSGEGNRECGDTMRM